MSENGPKSRLRLDFSSNVRKPDVSKPNVSKPNVSKLDNLPVSENQTSPFLEHLLFSGMPKSERVCILDRWLWFGTNWFKRPKSKQIIQKPNALFG